jgi:hypothetical protein
MTAADDRLRQWQLGRSARLNSLGWLRTDTSGGRPVRFVADELLVRDDHHATARDVLGQLGHPGSAVSQDEVFPGFQRLRVTGVDVPQAVRAIRRRTEAGAVGPNHVFLSSPYEHGGPFGPPVPPATASALPIGPSQDASVKVAVVDTGVWRNSPLPAEWYEAGAGDYDDSKDLNADVGHANFIAGVVLSATSNARVRIVRVLDAFGVCTEADLANALLGLPDVDVVNLSLGGYTADNQPPVALAAALGTLLTGADRVLVAAAGNDGVPGQPFWPAAFTTAPVGWAGQVLAVAAHDGTNLCGWSNTGPWVSVAAPGSQIISMYVTEGVFTTGWAQWSGTSFAAPYVVGALAERHPAAGSIVAAAKQLCQDAATRTYSSYPGLA